MKNYICAAALLLVASTAEMSAQYSVPDWSIAGGLRVGMGSMMQKSVDDSDRSKGFDGAAEFVYYRFFQQKKLKGIRLGLRTGLSLGYRQNSIMMDDIDITYNTQDAYGHSITYHATAKNVKETDRQFAAEVPVLFAASYRHYFANLGLRMGVPILSRYKQTMEDPSLSATYDEMEVTIRNEKVTGMVSSDDKKQKAKLDAASFNLCLSFEAGYDFYVMKRTLQAGIYVDYGLVDNFKGKGNNFTDADPTAIDGANSKPTAVVVHSITDSYVKNVGIFCVGLRAVYTFQTGYTQGLIGGSTRRKK